MLTSFGKDGNQIEPGSYEEQVKASEANLSFPDDSDDEKFESIGVADSEPSEMKENEELESEFEDEVDPENSESFGSEVIPTVDDVLEENGREMVEDEFEQSEINGSNEIDSDVVFDANLSSYSQPVDDGDEFFDEEKKENSETDESEIEENYEMNEADGLPDSFLQAVEENEENEEEPDAEQMFGEADEDGDFEEVNQTAGIAASEPSEKENYHENSANIFDRSKLKMFLLVGGGILFLLIMFVVPALAPKRKQKKSEGLESAGNVAVPNFVKDMDSYQEEDVVEEDPLAFAESPVNIHDAVRESYERDSYEDRFPDPLKGNSDSQIYTSVAGYEEEIDTRSDEQQKPFMDVVLTDSPSLDRINAILEKKAEKQSLDMMVAKAQADSKKYRSYTPAAVAENNDNYNTALLALIAQGVSTSDKDIYAKINDQVTKQNFMKNAAGTGGGYSYNSDYCLWKGTVIPAVLTTAIDTDLPGLIKATVTENVYSSQNGEYLLIPQGSELIAEYNSSVSFAQERIQVAWSTLIRPDGLEINLGNLPGIQPDGSSGYSGKVNHHTFELAKGLGLIAIFSFIDTKIGNQLNKLKTSGTTNKGPNWAGNNYYDNFSDTMTDAFGQISSTYTENAMAIQPSIRKNAGEKISLITNVTMDIPPLKKEVSSDRYILNK